MQTIQLYMHNNIIFLKFCFYFNKYITESCFVLWSLTRTAYVV